MKLVTKGKLFETEYHGIVNNKTKACEFVAFYVEALQGTGGYTRPPREYFSGLKKILDAYKILLVDDEPNTREVTSAVLQSFGAEVAEAGSASEALTLLQGFEPDILVSDIAMPLEDGYYLIGKVRALQSRLAQIPALALTAYAGERDILRAHQAGFDSHAAKPVDAHKLALAIATLAGRGAFLIPRNSPARQSLAGR